MCDQAGQGWLIINFGDHRSGIAFEAMLRLAASSVRVSERLQQAPSPAEVQLLFLFENADADFELVEVENSKKRWVVTAHVGWRALAADTDEESDWKLLSHVSAALLVAHTQRGLPLGLLDDTRAPEG